MKLKPFIISIITLFSISSLTSCNNETVEFIEQTETNSAIRVVNLSDYMSACTRSSDSISDEQVLKFPDERSYNQTLDKIRKMSESEKSDYFQKIGFDGAYTILKRADNELETIFDMDDTDSVAVCNEVNNYLTKYNGILAFNDSDRYDVTPSLKFEGKDIELVGSINGYVVVGDSLYHGDPFTMTSSTNPRGELTPSKMPYNGYFIEYKNVKVKNGKYSSFLRIGRKGQYIAFKTETYRKILFWKKYDKRSGYDAKLTISSQNGQTARSYDIHCLMGEWNLQGAQAGLFSPYMNIRVSDFSSTRNPKNKKSETFNYVLVR